MSSLSIRKSWSYTNVLVEVLDFLAICVGGWVSYQIRFAPAHGGWATMRPEDQLALLTLAVFASLFFGKVYRLWPGGSLAAMVGRVTVGWLLCWVSLMVVLVLTKTSDKFSRIWLVTWLDWLVEKDSCPDAFFRSVEFRISSPVTWRRSLTILLKDLPDSCS